MNAKLQELIYQRSWRGHEKIYNIKVENEYTTVIVKPGEDLNQPASRD